MKKLYKTNENKMICGVCQGLSEYSGIDVTFIRLIAVLITICTAGLGGILAYIIAAVIMPDKSEIKW